MRGSFLDAILGGLRGAGTGIAQQQQFKQQSADADLDRQIKGFQLASMQKPTQKKWTWDSDRAVFTSDDGDVREVPGIKPKVKPAETESWQTVETDKGFVQVNPKNGQVRPLGISGKPPAKSPDLAGERQDFQQSQGLQQRYASNPLVTKAYGTAGAIAGLKGALSGESPMDDLSTIYETVKLFDPNSAVKEGEIKLARSANSLPGQVGLLLEGWRSGKKLTPQMREQIQQLLERKMTESESSIRPVQAEMGATARRYGVEKDSAYIAPNPFQSFRPGGGVPDAAATLDPMAWLEAQRRKKP